MIVYEVNWNGAIVYSGTDKDKATIIYNQYLCMGRNVDFDWYYTQTI